MDSFTPFDNELEKLIALVEKGEAAEASELTEAERFVISVGIKDGETGIQAMVVWFRYTDWCKSLNRKPITIWSFFRQFKKLFQLKRDKTWRTYRLDPAPFDLSLDAYWIMRRKMRDSREKAARVKKKQNTLSRSRKRSECPD
jgi:hypothetical protein